MDRTRPIQIACPELGRIVRGSYLPGPGGRFVHAADGGFLLNFVRCGQDGGRCAQTLCALHRYNRRGPGTWFPDRVFALPERSAAKPQSSPPSSPAASSGLDLHA